MKVIPACDQAALAGVLDVGWSMPAALVDEVAAIIADIDARGDDALLEHARRFEADAFELSDLRVPIPMLESARLLVPPEIAIALELEKERLSRFQRRQRQPDIEYVEEDGTRYALVRRPLRSVAVYASRSGAPTSILMGAVPAKIAGVSRIAVLSPPGPTGFSPAVLFACALCGVDELYAIGGATAVAAAALGTRSLPSVDKIVGRGGRWTTEAKRQVFGRCGVDALAGPPEVLVVADEGANSEYVVGELLSAAERPDVTRLAVLSESRPLLDAVAQLIDTLDLQTLERSEFVSKAILQDCRLIAASSRDELLDVLNRFAPAYLCLQVRDAWRYLERIFTAGTVFIGDATPLVSGEHLAGTNRVAPTSGTARFSSSLCLADFTRTLSVVENSGDRMATDARALAALADGDGLPNHAQAARMRYGS
ncbi:MAG TPA: histidinol dehydrogenase [Candidatus Acidoferrum sp.]|jgi:histidinol dehydrogenase|nr:histidinol dehydrogenase [Candidatus Acidoferrum sp.]